MTENDDDPELLEDEDSDDKCAEANLTKPDDTLMMNQKIIENNDEDNVGGDGSSGVQANSSNKDGVTSPSSMAQQSQFDEQEQQQQQQDPGNKQQQDPGNKRQKGDGENKDNATDLRDDSIDYSWEVGDVEEDFQALEEAIRLDDIRDNAEENLKQVERMETLDAHAAQRRPLLADVNWFGSGTVVWALIFVGLKNLIKRSNNQLARLISPRWINRPWDLHFWLVVVVAPIVFLRHKRTTMKVPPPIPPELEGLPLEYLQFSTIFRSMTDWEDPNTSCKDYILCLAEQWVSAVKGAAGIGIFMLVCAAALRLPTRIGTLGRFSPFAVALLQFVTRLGAVVSLFQFPKLLFELQRTQQPRPVKAEVARLQGLVKSLFTWSMPVGLGSDLSKLLRPLKWQGLTAFCGAFVAFLSAVEIRYKQSRKPSRHPGEPNRVERVNRALAKACESLITTWVPSALMITASLFIIVNLWKPKNLGRLLPMTLLLDVIASGALLLALMRPIWHIIAFSRIVEILYTHDISLTTSPEAMRKIFDNPVELKKRYKWRSRLRWREPERVHIVFDRKWKKYWQWFFLSGTVQDKLMRERMKKEEEERAHLSFKMETIWERVAREMKREAPGTPKPDRRLWKKQAMDSVAEQHQIEYESTKGKGPFTDSLGVALQQRLGIGLRFAQDHSVKLKEGETPSTRRLQVRAVKSAIGRVNQIWTKVLIEQKRLKEEIKDEKQLEKRLKELDDRRKSEFDYLARRLSELVPTTSSKEDHLNFDFFQGFTKPIRVGGNLVMITSTENAEKSAGQQVLDNLLKMYDAKSVDKLKEEKNSNPPNESHPDEPYDYSNDVKKALADFSEKHPAGNGKGEGQEDNTQDISIADEESKWYDVETLGEDPMKPESNSGSEESASGESQDNETDHDDVDIDHLKDRFRKGEIC